MYKRQIWHRSLAEALPLSVQQYGYDSIPNLYTILDTDVYKRQGYAIPISQAKDIISDLMTKTTKVAVDENEPVSYTHLGRRWSDTDHGFIYGTPGGRIPPERR